VARAEYAFGDGDVAARRLALLADVFAPTSRAFLLREAPRRPALALDLGCGPGYTTRLIAETLRPGRTVGLDISDDFATRATAAATPDGVSFAVHDVVAAPLPEPAPDLVYARYLVTHVADPEAAIGRWAAQLAPGGRLLLEDTEAMLTDHPVFGEYIERVDERLAVRGHQLMAGPLLARVATRSALAVAAPPAGQVAAMFRLNLESWCDDEAVRRRLGAALETLTADPTPGVVTWRLRQAVVEPAAR
jgi:SAM-dependent methyltransferase